MMQLLSDEFLPLLGSGSVHAIRRADGLGSSVNDWGCVSRFGFLGFFLGGSLGIPREDRGNLENITEDEGNHHPPLKNPIIWE